MMVADRAKGGGRGPILDGVQRPSVRAPSQATLFFAGITVIAPFTSDRITDSARRDYLRVTAGWAFPLQ